MADEIQRLWIDPPTPIRMAAGVGNVYSVTRYCDPGNGARMPPDSEGVSVAPLAVVRRFIRQFHTHVRTLNRDLALLRCPAPQKETAGAAEDQRRKSFRGGSAKGFVGGVQRGMSVPRKCPWKRAVGQAGWCGRPVSNWSPEIRVKNKPNGLEQQVQRLRRHAFSSAAPPLHPAVSEAAPNLVVIVDEQNVWGTIHNLAPPSSNLRYLPSRSSIKLRTSFSNSSGSIGFRIAAAAPKYSEARRRSGNLPDIATIRSPGRL